MNSPLPATSYGFPVRALRRWSAENLTLTPRSDGGWEALFVLEGSTCGNIPFLLHYRVSLSSGLEQHRLQALACEPAPHDMNHREQCAARSDYARWTATVAGDAPLLGQPLAEALAWSPATSPDGCLCADASRAHKWRAVLQTIHFTLQLSSP
ncbi:MAG: hypothetical protein C0518_01880 [Opitutus sp.]|nr:hypothetical protein [Opitutus sp.]